MIQPIAWISFPKSFCSIITVPLSASATELTRLSLNALCSLQTALGHLQRAPTFWPHDNFRLSSSCVKGEKKKKKRKGSSDLYNCLTFSPRTRVFPLLPSLSSAPGCSGYLRRASLRLHSRDALQQEAQRRRTKTHGDYLKSAQKSRQLKWWGEWTGRTFTFFPPVIVLKGKGSLEDITSV